MEDLMDILGEFSEMLPEDVEMRFMDGDEPGVVISGESRERHERFAQEGKCTSRFLIYSASPTQADNFCMSVCSPLAN